MTRSLHRSAMTAIRAKATAGFDVLRTSRVATVCSRLCGFVDVRYLEAPASVAEEVLFAPQLTNQRIALLSRPTVCFGQIAGFERCSETAQRT